MDHKMTTFCGHNYHLQPVAIETTGVYGKSTAPFLPLSLWHNRRHQTTPFSSKSVSSLKTTGKHFPKTIKNK